MPLGTLDRTPPPFFRQGTPALTKLVLCSALAVFLMAADNRLKLTQPLRAAVATALLPVQRSLMVPVNLSYTGIDYLRGLQRAISAENSVRRLMASQAERAARGDQLALENTRLRALLDLRPALQVKSISAEVMYEAADPYSRKAYIDRGATHGIVLGAPVINEAGVLGQVTRVFPLNSMVTLLTDKDAAIPVLNARSQQRSAAFGGAAGGLLELRFMAGNADVQVGDKLVTSGVDGVYPAGLAVAQISRIDRKVDSGFAHILLAPAAAIDGVRHVLVLEPLSVQLPPPPEPAPTPAKPSHRTKAGAKPSASGAAP
ncbi:rod shape-determining protein MreC [Aquincola sp. S2]|uniref:Cell shape-determining protein MreC n=1 Tax=Pseudaquabacterium terrae TaxID=2732868 RepID=A0ABX2EKL9_9BURK|nr:rod shape-determining protein MreC [Aquabacterium terrae]NRF69182.1 rod shape-determining protein MreC [Aquabacterium terrae]